MQQWQPCSSLELIKQRAHLLLRARDFFQNNNLLEVETPLLAAHTVTEPNIESIRLTLQDSAKYLQTSPEYAMKRLLAAGVPDCYQICKAFRLGENGIRHNSEFTLLEWYRLDYDLQQIIQDTLSLCRHMSDKLQLNKIISYQQALHDALGISLADLSRAFLIAQAQAQGMVSSDQLSDAQLLDFVFSKCVTTHFSAEGLTVVYGYPAAQAALAKINNDTPATADRFEVFWQDLELANGYVELTDPVEQLARFQQDQALRAAMDLPEVQIDQRLLAAQAAGLPHCAGVALGLDRVLMAVSNSQDIRQVLSFDWHHA